jgi:hypothetical protein
MASDPKKRQKKLEKRSAKRKEKKHHLSRQQNLGLAERLSAASKFPVLDCWIGDALETEGMGTVLLSRELPDGRVAVASFLVDRYCLGIKDAFGQVVSRSSYEEQFRRRRKQMPASDVPPADARKLIEGAVAYAHGLGFHPHPDYARALPLFGAVNAADGQASFTFGKDGKPLFIAGPYDTPQRCRQILATLASSCGPDGFHYVFPLAGPEFDRAIPDAMRGPQGLPFNEDVGDDDELEGEEDED